MKYTEIDPFVIRGPILSNKHKNYSWPKIKVSEPKNDAIEYILKPDIELLCDVHVLAAASLTPWQAVKVIDAYPKPYKYINIPAITYTMAISYPLSTTAEVIIEPYMWYGQARQNVGWILWSIAQAYEYIYTRADDYYVWGHALNDLIYEIIKIKDDKINIFLGS